MGPRKDEDAPDGGTPGAPERALEERDRGVAGRLLVRKERILERWVQRVRQDVARARDEREPVLVDTLPAYLANLAQALSPHHPRAGASDGSTISQEHGSERARITDYRIEDVIREFQLLREVLFEVLGEEVPLTEAERSIILRSIDRTVLESCTAFVLVHTHLREQTAATLTHDLRGPLSAAKAGAGLILRRGGDPDVQRWAVRIIDSIDRADAMIRDLLDASRLRVGQRLALTLGPCELVSLVREVLDRLQTVHGERFVLVAPEPVEGIWSREALQRAVENLGTNAVKYGSETQSITVTVRGSRGRALLQVHNHGSYIPAEEQENLFQAFRRARAAQQSGKRGWGLGLALVRGVAEAHGGSIGVESMPERGTTFAIDIPVDARPFQQAPTLG